MAKERKELDLLIIGGGMAGLTAALYAGRMNLKTLVLENALVGGQIANATGIENYPGLPDVSGADLISTLQQQAETYGAEVDEFDVIVRVTLTADEKVVETEHYIYVPKAVIIASGMQRRKLGIPDEAKYLNRGFHFCEQCDGFRYQGKRIAVAGGGNAAVDAANFLDKYGAEVYIIHRSPKLTADQAGIDKFNENPKNKAIFNTLIEGASGEKSLESLRLKSKETGETYDLPMDAVFVNIGVEPNTALFAGQIDFAENGRIKAGEDCRTNVPGVFAAGDIRDKEVRQLTTAASDGTTAAILAEKYIAGL